jgi:hypothetical protein
MALSRLQQDILTLIARNRSETSYIAGGVALNRNWIRLSDDIDVFHDTDEEIGASADIDIAALKSAGFRVSIVVNVYGCVEAEVSKDRGSTLIQWMSETRTRFFPLVRDAEWGARLHAADLAVNKVLAASSRTKARDFVDLVAIDENYCPLGTIILAAAGKPPHYSPVRIIDEMRRRGLSITSEELDSVKTLQNGVSATMIREKLVAGLDRAEAYVRRAPAQTVGLLAVDSTGTPFEVSAVDQAGVTFRKATAEPEVIPGFADTPGT